MVNAGPYLRAVREQLARRGVDLYLIADVVYWEAPDKLDWAFLREHFQAVTAYNMYYRPKFLEAVPRQFKAADRAARTRGLWLIPNVMPGYDDTPFRGTERVPCFTCPLRVEGWSVGRLSISASSTLPDSVSS